MNRKWMILKNDGWFFERKIPLEIIPNDRTILVTFDRDGGSNRWVWHTQDYTQYYFYDDDFIFSDAPRIGQVMDFLDDDGRWVRDRYGGYSPFGNMFLGESKRYTKMRHPKIITLSIYNIENGKTLSEQYNVTNDQLDKIKKIIGGRK